jgi:hypothetical protein
MQDQRELIQHERGADTDRHRGERAPAERVGAANRREAPMISRMMPGTE